VSRVHRTCGRDKGGNLNEIDHLEDLKIHERIILKWILTTWGGLYDLIYLRMGTRSLMNTTMKNWGSIKST
jgi:hypothetical protein